MDRHTEEHDEPADGIERPWWVPSLSLRTMLVVTAIAAVLVPQDWVDSLNELYGKNVVHTDQTFSDEVSELERALLAGEPLDPDEARRFEHELYARRALSCGSFTEPDVIALEERLPGFDHELDTAGSPEGRAAMRRAQVQRLADTLPRADRDCLLDVFTSLDALYASLGAPPPETGSSPRPGSGGE